MLISAVLLPVVALVSPASAQTATGYEHQVVSVTNGVRESHHLSDLRTHHCLTKFAEKQARRMAREQRLYHQDLRVPLRRCGLGHVGENVAVGYPNGRAVVKSGWMKSAGHRANILTKSFRRIAVGAYQDSRGRWWAAQLFSS